VSEILLTWKCWRRKQTSEGGWGYASGQPAHLEPTCLALLALSLESERFHEAIDRGRAVLRKSLAPDGTYRLARGRDEAVWPTARVLFVLSALGDSLEELHPTASALLQLRGRTADKSQTADVNDIDLNLVGWPWAEGNFSWAEPTAWAVLGLRRAGFGEHPHVKEGIHLLIDRTFPEGGINYGNRNVLEPQHRADSGFQRP